jgi:6-phosphogluconolactonase
VQHIYEDEDALLKGIADFFIKEAQKAIDKAGTFSVALSGGNSPKKLYTLLSSEKYKNLIAWEKVSFFFGDERFVPHDDVQSNYRMANETLFRPLGIVADHIYPIDTSVSPAQSAKLYDETLRRLFPKGKSLDFILLGLGDNSHTASLFPHTDVLTETTALVKEVFVEEVNQFRITFTAPLINSAMIIAFLVYGPSKASAVYNILKERHSPQDYPAQLVKPSVGELHWFIDKEAAKLVSDSTF